MAQNIAAALTSREVSEEILFKAFTRIHGVFEDLLQEHQAHELDAGVFRQHQELAQRIRAAAGLQ